MMVFWNQINFTFLVMIWAEWFNFKLCFGFVFNEWKEIKIFEAFVVQGSIPLSSESQKYIQIKYSAYPSYIHK